MPVIINFKACDNAKECSGIAECPTGAMFWNEKDNKIDIDQSKCILCKVCQESCPVGAIYAVDTDEEYEKIKSEIDKDPNSVEDLFVDRYGAIVVDKSIILDANELESKVSEFNGLSIIEFFNEDSIQCLRHSIPVQYILNEIKEPNTYRKVEVDDSIRKKYNVKELPAMLFFRGSSLIGKIEGFYDSMQLEKLMPKVSEYVRRCK